jgi:predicted Zn-dependent protease
MLPRRAPWHAVLLLLAAACGTTPAIPDRPPAPAKPDGAALLRQADEAFGMAQFAVAGARYEEAARLLPADPRPPLGLARVALANGKVSEALPLLDRSIALGETPEALLLRGRTLGIARRFDAAAHDLDRALALAPGDGSGWPILAAVQVNRGDDVASRRAYEAAVKALGSGTAADRLWTMLLAMPPDPLQPQESLDRCARGQAAMFQGRWADAAHEQRNGLRNAPGFAYCIALAGVTAARLGDAAGAERALRKAVADLAAGQPLLGADAQAWLAAFLLEKGGSGSEAVGLARASLATRGDRAATLDVLARACAAIGDPACAREASERLLRLPDLPDAMRAAAQARVATPAGAPGR